MVSCCNVFYGFSVDESGSEIASGSETYDTPMVSAESSMAGMPPISSVS